MEHSGQMATFLNRHIQIMDGKFVYKLFDKRNDFPFSIVRMPHRESNIPESIFYWSPDFSRNWDLRIHPRASVRPSVRPFQEFSMTIHCIFLKFCMELQLYMGGNVTFSDS